MSKDLPPYEPPTVEETEADADTIFTSATAATPA